MNSSSIAHQSRQAPASAETPLPFAATVPAAEAWLQRLAGLGYGDACRQLFQALRVLNRMDLAVHPRLQLLEVLRPPVLEFSRRLEPYFVDQSFPLEDKTAKVVRLAVQFQAELALGYQRVLESAICAQVFTTAQQATVAHRTLTAYGVYLLRSAQSYEAPTAKVWQKLYAAYRSAESMGVAEVAVDDLDCTLASSTTASECLRKIVLFQLAQPTRLPQREMGELFAWFDQNSHLAGLRPERAFNLQEAHYYVDLAEAAAPRPIGALSASHDHVRYLFLQPLLLESLQSSSACSTFGLCVARRLMPAGEVGHSAGQGRSALFAAGVEGATALLGADVALVRRRLNGQDSGKGLDLCPEDVNPRARLSARVAGRLPGSSPKLESVSREAIWGGSDPVGIAAQHCSQGVVRYLDNETRALLIADRRSVGVGRLLALANEGMLPVLGVVRSMTQAEDPSRVWADVELFKGTISTARAYVEGEQRRRLPCVLVTGEHGMGHITSIMLLPTIFANGTWVTLEQNGKWSNQRLARLIEAGEDFCQYHLVEAE